MVENSTPGDDGQDAPIDGTVVEAETSLGTTQNVAGLLT
jgi:hypothetical protein